MFFIFLTLFILFTLTLIAIQSITRLNTSQEEIDRLISVSVNKADVEKFGDVSELNSVILAVSSRANNAFFSASDGEKLTSLSDAVGRLSADFRILKTEVFVFKMMIGGISMICGLIAAFLAITGQFT